MTYIYIGDIKRLYDKEIYDKVYSQLPKERQKKASNFKNERDKLLSVMAGYLLDMGMKDQGCKYPLLSDGLGYLHSKNEPRYYFSISHSANIAVCAVSDENIGCDVEEVGRFMKERYLNKDGAFYKKILTKKEKDYLNVNDVNDIAKLWTRKESYSKLMGKGIAMDFRKIETTKDNLFKSFTVMDKDNKEYMISLSGKDINSYKISYIELGDNNA